MKKALYTFLLLAIVSVKLASQDISNIHFKQVGKQIHIYYDLEGNLEYTVKFFAALMMDKTGDSRCKK